METQRNWGAYWRIAPVSWLIERDVAEGRRHLNLSTWEQMPPHQLQTLEEEVVQQTKRGAMPPLPYRIMHWRAALQPSDLEALAKLIPTGTDQARAVTAGDVERGRALFGRRCSGCHAIDSEREGPHLRGVFGRRAGSVSGFRYSSAIRNSGITWADANLDKWLSDSEAIVPGSAMGFTVPKPQERLDLIAFLRSLR